MIYVKRNKEDKKMSKIYNRPPSKGYNEFLEFINNLSDYNGAEGLSLNQKTIAKTLGRSQSTINDYVRDAREDGYITNKQLVIYKASQKNISHEYDVDKAKVAKHLAEQGILPDESKAKENIAKFKEACICERKQKRNKQTAKVASEVKKDYIHGEVNIEYVDKYNLMLLDLGLAKFRDFYLDDNKLRATNIICGTWNPEVEHKKPNNITEEEYTERLNKRATLLKEFGIENPVEYDVNGSIYRLTYNLTHDEQLSQEVDIYELFWKKMGYKQAFTKEVRDALKETAMPIYMKPQAIGTTVGKYNRVKAITKEGTVKVKLTEKEQKRFDSYKVWEEMGIDLKALLYDLRDAMKAVLGVDKFFNRAIFYYESDLHAIMKIKLLTDYNIRVINAYDGFYGDKDNENWTEEVFFETYASATDILKQIIASTEKITVFANREDQAQDEEEITNEVREVATIVIMPTLPKGNLWRMTEGIEAFRKEAKQKRFAPQKEEIKSNSFTNAEMIYILEKQLEYKVFDDKEEEEIKAEIAQLKQTA